MIAGVYTIKNIRNNKVYVGRSIDIESRWEAHKKDLSNGTHRCVPLQYEYYLYGEKAFVYNIEWILCQGDNLHNKDIGKELELKESKIGVSLDADMAKTGYNFVSKFTHGERDLECIQIDKKTECFIKDNIDDKAVEVFKSILAHYDNELKCSMTTFPTIQKETGLGRKRINKYLQQLEKHKFIFQCEEKFNRFTLFFFMKKEINPVVVEQYLLKLGRRALKQVEKAKAREAREKEELDDIEDDPF